jgi:general secretion pathway protein G
MAIIEATIYPGRGATRIIRRFRCDGNDPGFRTADSHRHHIMKMPDMHQMTGPERHALGQPVLRARGDRVAAGFTLLELLVVMVIIGLLAGYVGPRYFAQIGKSEVKTARAQIDAFEKALDQYRLDTGRYPGTEQGLDALVVRPENEPKWAGPYLRKAVPADPWGNAYVYRSPGEHGEYDLLSYGKDGKPGGADADADITNW